MATITWARTKEEEQVLISSLKHLEKTGLTVFVTDAGSPASFLAFLNSCQNFILSTNSKGVWPQVNQSLQLASEKYPFVFYSEPDKEAFFINALPAFLDKNEADENTGVVIASRSDSAFASFPSFQQMTETTINRCCAEVIGKKIDYVYGPFLMNSKLIESLQVLPADIGWGWRPFVFNTARRLGFHVNWQEGDFFCPDQQQNDDGPERLYRMKQLTQNIEGLLLSEKS